MFGMAIRYIATKPKPKMKPIELKTPPEQTQTITRVIFDIVKEHGPLTIGDTWDRVKEVRLRGLTSKRHMKIVLRWMRERQKLRLICNHKGPHKRFLYTTWFTKSNINQAKPDKCRTPQLLCTIINVELQAKCHNREVLDCCYDSEFIVSWAEGKCLRGVDMFPLNAKNTFLHGKMLVALCN